MVVLTQEEDQMDILQLRIGADLLEKFQRVIHSIDTRVFFQVLHRCQETVLNNAVKRV